VPAITSSSVGIKFLGHSTLAASHSHSLPVLLRPSLQLAFYLTSIYRHRIGETLYGTHGLAHVGRNRYPHAMAPRIRKPSAVEGDTDRAGRKLIPCFDDFYQTVLELLPFEPDSRFEVLDLGANTGLLSAMIAEAFPKARLTLFDLTPERLTTARQRLKPLGRRVKFVTADLAAAAQSQSYNAIVSALAIYHLPDTGKRHLFADIFKYLTPGGIFINADQVAGETMAIDQRQRQMWMKRARELKVGERDLNAALELMKLDLPATVGQHLAWMREAGFAEVACAYRNLIFAVLSGTKRVNAKEAGPEGMAP
jgi:tRNA (cmo5U34)-methyltransferase